MRSIVLACCALLAACVTAPGPAASVTLAEIEPILTPLVYRELLGQKCREPNTAVKTAFLADLKAAGASSDLLVQARAAAGRIEMAERDTPNEYVCTAELFESTQKNAEAAQKAWSALKKSKS